MAMLVAYEVQTFEEGSWQIASMFDDNELALIEARRLEEGLRRRETRVVEETHDEESNRTKSKVVYTSPKIRPEAGASVGDTKPQPVMRDYPRTRRKPSAGKKKQPGLIWICLKLFLIVVVGVMALILVRQF